MQFVLYAAMEFKYRWFIGPEEDKLLHLIIFVMLGCCAALWVLLPSRVAVGVITALCFVSPAFIDPENYSFRYSGFALFNVPTIIIFCVLIMLPVGIAHWCQKLKSKP